MRTRSVQLVTSWWVVGVWAVVSLATGLVSVVAVLQPAWYVRYSQIHAQDAQGVAFQVMVSSVGPLGYCRLAGVKQMVPAVEGKEKEKGRPDHAKSSTVSPDTTLPSLRTLGLPSSSTGTSDSPLETLQEDFSTTLQSPIGHTHIPFSSKGIRSTTLPSEEPQEPSPSEDMGVDGNNASVHTDKLTSFEATTTTITTTITTTTITTISDNSMVTEANILVDIPLTTMQRSISGVDTLKVGEEKKLKKKESKNVMEIPGTSTEETSTPGMQAGEETGGGAEAGGGSSSNSSGRKRQRKPHRPVNAAGAGGATRRKNTTTVGRGRRKKGKHRRGKKKNKNRKRTRPREGGGAKTGAGNRGASRPDYPLHHLLRSSLEEREVPVASPLHQHLPQDTLISQDYRPRSPILHCSGVGGGVGSGSSAVWALVGVLYGVAGVVQVVVGVASFITHLLYLNSHARKYVMVAWLGNAQVAVVMGQGVALVLFPLGLGSPLARVECGGSSSVYWSGGCTFGWSYMLAVVATTLAAYCPCLARLTVFRKYDYKEWDSVNFY